jgi:hypothetical protein
MIVPTLIKLGIRYHPPARIDPPKPLLQDDSSPVTTEKYMSLWRYEMDDKNSATSVPVFILHYHFLPSRHNDKDSQLLMFHVFTRTHKNKGTK